MIKKKKKTDLQHMLIMLSKTKEPFSKEESVNSWMISLPEREISIYFNEDDSLNFIKNKKQ